MPAPKPVVGIDLGGTNVQIGVVGTERKVIGSAKRKTKPDEGRDAVISRIVDGIEEACTQAKLRVSDLSGVGIGAPGAIDPDSGVVLEAVNLRWNEVPLAKLLSDKVKAPVFVDNDVNAAVYGENKLGAGENARDLLGVWLGTGIGGGLILNGSLYYGTFMTAGEIGHTILFPGIPLGSRSLEHNCSRTAVVDRIIRLIKSNRKSVIPSLVDGDLDEVKSKTVAKAYQMGDELTIQVVDHAADLIGIGIANMVTMLSLGRVVLGGGLTEALGEPLVDRVKKSVRANVFPEKCKQVKVVGTKLLDDAGVLGAALIAWERMK
jgi:glucokinase